MSDHDSMVGQIRDQWDGAADAWRRWRSIFDQRRDPAEFVRLSGVEPGGRALDVGAGAGDIALPLATHVGAGGRVTATDVSDSMLGVARERAAAAGLTNIDFVATPGHVLDGVEPGYDAATMSLALMLVPEPAAVAQRVHEIVRPGGRFVVSVWSTPDKAPFLSLPMMVGVMEFGLAPPAPGGPGLFALGQPGQIDDLLTGAGFDQVSHETFPFVVRFESPDEYATCTRELAAALTSMVAEQIPDRVEEFWGRVADTAGGQAADDGSVSFDNEIIVATANRS
jgi:ubiquinone/menaquinone biosynthesis C-methylase UbiE